MTGGLSETTGMQQIAGIAQAVCEILAGKVLIFCSKCHFYRLVKNKIMKPSGNFIEELKWRRMLHDATPGVEDHINSVRRLGYIGFDPTRESLTIGNYVQVMILTLFQKCGHRPIVLMGGATGRIGDPSGKDAERELQDYSVLDENVRMQEEQFRKYLDFDDPESGALMLNNLDFYDNMNALDFLRVIGKNLTVNYMLSKESVKKRLETGISFTEFSYQLLQGYDFLTLYRNHNCTMQMGGSDQWGNITSGIEFVRRNEPDGKVFAVTTPLLTKSDGTKFGKSESGNIWLDPNLTSPYQFYQFWINADDQDISRFLRYFSLRSHAEIEALEAQAETDPIAVKREFAQELTTRIHSEESYQQVMEVSRILFDRKLDNDSLRAMSPATLDMLAAEVPTFEVTKAELGSEVPVPTLMASLTGISSSTGEARRSIQSNAVSINKEKVQGVESTISEAQALYGRYILLENGKKNKFIITLR